MYASKTTDGLLLLVCLAVQYAVLSGMLCSAVCFVTIDQGACPTKFSWQGRCMIICMHCWPICSSGQRFGTVCLAKVACSRLLSSAPEGQCRIFFMINHCICFRGNCPCVVLSLCQTACFTQKHHCIQMADDVLILCISLSEEHCI